MVCVTPTIVAAVLLCLADCSLSASVNSCWTVQSGLPYTRAVYIDGTLLPTATRQSFTISQTSSVAAVKIAKGVEQFTQTLNKLPRWVYSKYVCTTARQSNSLWTGVSFSDSAWPYTSNLFTSNIYLLALTNDLYCRFYLTCSAVTTTTKTTKKTKTTKRPNNSWDDSSDDNSHDRDSTRAQTSTEPTTTASPFPTIQGTSGSGSFAPGQPATLQCSFSAVNPPTTVAWFLNGIQLIDSNSNTAVQSDGSLLATYSISTVGVPTAGVYTCQGSNANGAGAVGPAVTIAVTGDYLSSLLDNSNYLVEQLDGSFDQQVLLQASQGCAGLQIQFQSDSAIDSSYGDYAYFDGSTVQVSDAVSSTWPSDCNNNNVWIWVQISTSSGFSVGTGPVIGQNVAVSTTTLSNIPDTYVAIFNYGSSAQTVYLY